MKPLHFLTFMLFASIANAKNYYVSESGNDINNGLSILRPWKTIAKLNNAFATFSPGDSVLFQRGNTFYGTIIIGKGGSSGIPIVIGGYGIGAKPVITGFTNITGWTNEGGGIYSKVITSESLTNMVTIDGLQYGMGRYPDNSYLRYTTFTGNTKIVDPGLGTSTNWTGAEVVIRKNDWSLSRCNVINHTVDTVTYSNINDTQTPYANFGFFFQNDIRTLTSYGEWYHNTTNGKFFMYFGSIDPNTKLVRVSTINNLFFCNGNTKDNIVINGIVFTGSIKDAVAFQFAIDNCLVTNCKISFAGGSGINFKSNGLNNTISNNIVSECNYYGVYDYGINTIINYNSISEIGLIAGQSIEHLGYSGIYQPSLNCTINYNNISKCGYVGIMSQGQGASTVQFNRIDSIGFILDDGGGIYTTSPQIAVRNFSNNIISNIFGNSDGTPNNTPSSAGIYIDENASNCLVNGNTIFDVPFNGIKLHKAANNNITNNTTFNCSIGIGFEDWVGNQIRKNNISNNIFFAKTSLQFSWKMRSVTNDLTMFGTAANNYYTRPINDNEIFDLHQPSTGRVYRTIEAWKTFVSQDALSKKSVISVSDSNNIKFYYNATSETKTITLDAKYMGVDSALYNGTITLNPFSSAILLKTGKIDAAIKATAGNDVSLVLPSNSTTLKGIVTGSVISYEWKKVLGPSQYSISTPNSANTNISNLRSGKYTFQFKVKNSVGDSAFATVQVFVAGVLPVKLIDFSAKNTTGKIALKWQTASEINVSHYSIERSSDRQVFNKIGTVNSNNIANNISDYSFNDILPLEGISYYRLAMVDKDGSVNYSKIVFVNSKNSADLSLIYCTISNANANIKLSLNSNHDQVVNLAVIDVNGSIIITTSLKLQKGINLIDKRMLNRSTGVYYVKLITNHQSITKAVLNTL